MENTIPSIGLYKKIAKVKETIGTLSKTLENPFYKSAYFDINLLIEHVEPLLQQNNLLLMQPIINGHVVSRIIDLETGEADESSLKLPEINDAQKIGSCITFFRRYSLQSQLGIRAEDDDANKASGKTSGTETNQSKTDTKEDNRPWLTEPLLQSALKRIANKEANVYQNMDKAFKMKKEYREQLKSA